MIIFIKYKFEEHEKFKINNDFLIVYFGFL
jgi:hypothetical protein